MKMRQPLQHAAIPILATSVGLVLVLLALAAGHQPDSMEDYSIVTFNTSELWDKILRNPTEGTQPISAGSVGLHQFYSLHVLGICEGDFAPNTPASHAALNVTSCWRVTRTGVFSAVLCNLTTETSLILWPLAQLNLTALFARDVGAGSSGLSLEGLGFTQDLTDAFDQIAAAFMAAAALFITGIVLMGSFLAASVCAVLAVQRARLAMLVGLVLAWLGWLVLLLATAISQGTASTIASKVNELGDHAGLSAAAGTRFSAITWTAVCLALVAALSWSWTFARHRRRPHDSSFACIGRTRLSSRSGSMMMGLEGHDEVVETKVLGRRRTLTFHMVQPPQAAYLAGDKEIDSA